MKPNINCFDYCVLVIANELYNSFPMCQDLDPFALSNNDNLKLRCQVKDLPTVKGEEQDITDSERLAYTMGQTIFWLAENGFLQYNQNDEDRNYQYIPMYNCVRLSAKGLLVLKSTPKSLKNNQTLGELVGETLTTSVKKLASDNVLPVSITLIEKLNSYL